MDETEDEPDEGSGKPAHGIPASPDNSITSLEDQHSLPDSFLLPEMHSRNVDPSIICRPIVYVFVAAVLSAIGGILFGYDVGVVSGALLQLRETFHMTCIQQELVVSALLFGALLASLVGGFLVDHCGRRASIIANAGIFIFGAGLLTFSPSYSVLICGRMVVGFAVSLSAIAECTYISEIAPAARRGLLVSLNELGITLGFLLAYLISFGFIQLHNGWRFMFGLSVIPAVIQGIGMMFLPASPRFLMITGQREKATKMLKKLRDAAHVESELDSIQISLQEQQGHSFTDLFKSEDNMRLRLLTGIAVVLFQQVTGQPNVLYYAPTVFQFLGFESDSAATLATVGLGVVKVLFTMLSLLCVDRAGRRKFLLAGTTMMLLGICALGVVTLSWAQSKSVSPCGNHTSFHGLHSTLSDQNATLEDGGLNINNSWVHVERDNTINMLLSKRFLALSRSDKLSKLILRTSFSQGPYEALHVKTLNVQPDYDYNTKSQTQAQAKAMKDLVLLPADLYSYKPAESHQNERAALGLMHDIDLDVQDNLNNTAVPNTRSHLSGTRWIALLGIMTFVAGYAIGFGPVSWLIISEIFPSSLRGRAVSMATVFNWGTNIIISMTFLDLTNALGLSWTFLSYGLVCVFALVFIALCIPETKGRSLEQISTDLKTGLSWKKFSRTPARQHSSRSNCTHQIHYEQLNNSACQVQILDEDNSEL